MGTLSIPRANAKVFTRKSDPTRTLPEFAKEVGYEMTKMHICARQYPLPQVRIITSGPGKKYYSHSELKEWWERAKKAT